MLKMSQNGSVLEKISFEELIDIMEREAKKRNAPVYTLKSKLKTPFHYLISAVLSSRTKDETTAKAVERLFSVADTPEKLMKLPVEEIEKLIYGVGFYRIKARKIKKLAEKLVKEYNSKVPDKFEELIKLDGVGRKTANVVLAGAFGKNVIGVDTHVHRISNRLGIVKTKNPEDTEKELYKIVPDNLKNRVNKAFVGFGQVVCKPNKPLCGECKISKICPKIGVKTTS